MRGILRSLKTLFRLLFVIVLTVGGAKALDYEMSKKQAAQKKEQERIWAWEREHEAEAKQQEVENRKVTIEAAIKSGSRICVEYHKERIWFLYCNPDHKPCQLETDVCDKYEPRR